MNRTTAYLTALMLLIALLQLGCNKVKDSPTDASVTTETSPDTAGSHPPNLRLPSNRLADHSEPNAATESVTPLGQKTAHKDLSHLPDEHQFLRQKLDDLEALMAQPDHDTH